MAKTKSSGEAVPKISAVAEEMRVSKHNLQAARDLLRDLVDLLGAATVARLTGKQSGRIQDYQDGRGWESVKFETVFEMVEALSQSEELQGGELPENPESLRRPRGRQAKG